MHIPKVFSENLRRKIRRGYNSPFTMGFQKTGKIFGKLIENTEIGY